MGRLEQRAKAGMDVLLAALYRYNNCTYRAIADGTGIPLASAHRAVQRGLKNPRDVRRAAVILRIGKVRNPLGRDVLGIRP